MNKSLFSFFPKPTVKTLIGGVALALSSTFAGAITVSLSATADTTLIQNFSDDNYGGRNEVLIGATGASQQRAGLLRFDTTSIPSGATIDSMILRIVIFREAATTSWQVNMLREGNTGWVEGTATGESGPDAGFATWDHMIEATDPWLGGSSGARLVSDIYGSMGTLSLTNGTDVVDDVIDTTLTVGTTGFADLTALVNHWNTGANNAGLQIYGGNGQWGFDSKEGSGAAQLIIDYTPVPEPGAAALLLLSGLGIAFRRRR